MSSVHGAGRRAAAAAAAGLRLSGLRSLIVDLHRQISRGSDEACACLRSSRIIVFGPNRPRRALETQLLLQPFRAEHALEFRANDERCGWKSERKKGPAESERETQTEGGTRGWKKERDTQSAGLWKIVCIRLARAPQNSRGFQCTRARVPFSRHSARPRCLNKLLSHRWHRKYARMKLSSGRRAQPHTVFQPGFAVFFFLFSDVRVVYEQPCATSECLFSATREVNVRRISSKNFNSFRAAGFSFTTLIFKYTVHNISHDFTYYLL